MAGPSDLIKRFNDIKTLPHVAIRLTRLMADENASIKKFEEVIRMDPSLVVRLLRVVNSPYYGLQQRVESISRAVVFVGMRNLRNMVVTEAMKDIFKQGADDKFFSREGLWMHCAAVAICSQMISERIFSQKGEDVYLCGILHDIGMVVEDQVAHDAFIRACRGYESGNGSFTGFEREEIGTDHCLIGHELSREWGLSLEIQDGIRDHHRKMKAVEPSSIKGIIQITEFIVTQMGYLEIPGMKVNLSEPLARHVKENLREYKVIARDLPSEMTKAKDLYEIEDA